MGHELVNQLFQRAERDKSESDFAYFFSLLIAGEALSKAITLGMLAAVEDETEKHRYRLEYKLVRAQGLGDWYEALTDILTGPASSYLVTAARSERNEFTKNTPKGAWQNEAVFSLKAALDSLNLDSDSLGSRTNLMAWFRIFTTLRNHTRGHGATLPKHTGQASVHLVHSLETITYNLNLFKRPWVYLHRNLSGKYRVSEITHTGDFFGVLRSESHHSFVDGIYIDFESPKLVPLMLSDPDFDEFFVPNDKFNNHSHELLSYTTDNRTAGDSSRYLTPPNALESETHGYPELQAKGNCFSNAPDPSEDYVNRQQYEDELLNLLLDERRRVVTLQGSGGVGKTSLALQVIDRLTRSERFEMIVWFSARDIDLLPTGPKSVRPGFLSKNDIARQYCRFVLSEQDTPSRPTALQDFFQQQLSKSDGGPCLFIFDNFETVQDRSEMFHWIERSVAPPNKVLITTRLRDFKGDYPMEIKGMSHIEAEALISQTALKLNIFNLIKKHQMEQLITESEGHPYVIKIILGEVADKKRFRSPKQIVAASSDILTALFERTYDALTPCGKRAFLTLSTWKSAVPRVALEAVMMKSTGLRSEVENSIDSLIHYSLAENHLAGEDNQEFIRLTLAAHLFGNSVLQTSFDKLEILADAEILQMFAPTTMSDRSLDLGRILPSFIKNLSDRVDQGDDLTDYDYILDMICRSYNPGRLQLAKWFMERDSEDHIDEAISQIEAFIRYEHNSTTSQDAWRLLAQAYWLKGNLMGEINAWLERAQLEGVTFYDVSRTANYINHKFHDPELGTSRDMLAQRMLQIMVERMDEADADDFSRMAWLAMNTKQHDKAREFALQGLNKDPENPHCLRIANRLGMVV